jgi:hypothetical protein
MRDGFPQFLALIALFAPSSAKATNMAGAPLVHCRIITGENFLTGDVNGKMVCAEIERAIAAVAPRARYSAEVRAMPRSRLSATLVVNGRTLPEQNFAVMDHDLDLGSIRRFAAAVAAAVAKAAQ